MTVSETARRSSSYSRPREVGISSEVAIGRIGYTPEALRARAAAAAKERVRAARAVTIRQAITQKLTFEEWLEVLEMLGLGWPGMDGDAPCTPVPEWAPPAPLAVPLGCGTIAGWVRHTVAATAPCGACQAARAMVPCRKSFRPDCPRSRADLMDSLFARAVANNVRTLAGDLTDNERVWAALLIIQEGGHANTVQRRMRVSRETAEMIVAAICTEAADVRREDQEEDEEAA